MPDYREVVVRLDYDSKTAEIWCARRTVEKRLARLGWRKDREQIGGTWWSGPLRGISFRSLASMQSKRRNVGNPAALAKARATRDAAKP